MMIEGRPYILTAMIHKKHTQSQAGATVAEW